MKTSNEFVNSQENISMSKIGNCSRAGLNDVSRVIILDLYGMVFDAVVKNTLNFFPDQRTVKNLIINQEVT